MTLTNTDPAFLALLPEFLRDDLVSRAVAEAFDGEYQGLVREISAVQPWENLSTLTEPALSLMAYDVNPLMWDPDWSDEIKREVLKNATRWRMIHGTGLCVEEFTSTVIGTPATVRPWHMYGGEPGRFRVYLDATEKPVTKAAFTYTHGIINRAKNTRSHLDALEITMGSHVPVVIAVTHRVDAIIDIYPAELEPVDEGIPVAVGVAAEVVGRMQIYP